VLAFGKRPLASEEVMKIQRALIVLSIVNLALLAFSLARLGASGRWMKDAAPVLRGRALEIVDEHGKVRASITIFPADPTVVMPDGTTGYPETVLLRLINSKGRPNVKIEATELGGGVGLGGENDPTYITLSAWGTNTALKLRNKDGRQQIIQP
jgi:hypothetical protein